MPGLSGIDAVKKLRKEFHNAKNIPVIALTAHAMQEDKNKALDAGCNAYLTKPIQPRFILEKIQELLKK
jgi:CheY-like chemotaxis protein